MVDISKLTKLFYTISDVSSMFGINDSTLRYWEVEFNVLHPKKNRKGDRRYAKKDILIIDKIYILLKERGFTIKGAIEELRSITKTENNTQKVIQKLNRIKRNLQRIQSQL